ncbi:TolC family protein [Burkholderia vietnamiensis]|uniref:TolC family protein n=1 Tax=Burkholderia vietnamiensis TaxID=60552 RepID=UPI001E291C7D|nr:TolC family protein [Burkholderia vietnamiensis]
MQCKAIDCISLSSLHTLVSTMIVSTLSSRWKSASLCVALCGLITGCTTYHEKPLSQVSTALSKNDLARFEIDSGNMPLPELAAHRFDPSDGLDIEDVAMLAVANNPDLKLARDDLGIAQAQAFAAGLLPDPQLSVSSDFPGASGLERAFNYGLSMDVMAIVSRGANKRSAIATARKTDLGLLWQEWQVVAQAKQLYTKARYQDAVLPLLEQARDLDLTRYVRIEHARHAGNMTDDAVSVALTTYGDARKQYDDMVRAREQTHHDLNLLLGLAPDVGLNLVGSSRPAVLSRPALDAALAALPKRRPDLIALQAGYEAQEQKYRAAILNQFPSLTVGFDRARDTSGIYTTGFQIALSLPIFNRNRGNVAIEQATRQRLADEYQARLNAAYADIAHLRNDSHLAAVQLAQDEAALPALVEAAGRARKAFAAHDIALGQYTDAQLAALTRQIDAQTQRDALAEQRIGLQALLGSAIPDAFSTDSTPR